MLNYEKYQAINKWRFTTFKGRRLLNTEDKLHFHHQVSPDPKKYFFSLTIGTADFFLWCYGINVQTHALWLTLTIKLHSFLTWNQWHLYMLYGKNSPNKILSSSKSLLGSVHSTNAIQETSNNFSSDADAHIMQNQNYDNFKRESIRQASERFSRACKSMHHTLYLTVFSTRLSTQKSINRENTRIYIIYILCVQYQY